MKLHSADRLSSLWVRVSLLGLGYLGLALISRLLALPPGFASPVWPAAGLALGALLVWGWRCWPGVFLGSLLFNSWQDFHANGSIGLGVALGIACGAALQGLLGAALVRRFLDAPAPLSRVMTAAQALLYAGPLACIASASIGVGTLHGFGRLPIDGLGVQWLTWWVGDAVGVLLFAPLTCLLLPGSKWSAPRRAAGIALPLLITSMVYVMVSLGLDRVEESTARQEVAERAGKVIETAKMHLPDRIEELRSIARLFGLQREINLEEYQAFVAPLLDLPSLIAVEWAPRVIRKQRDGSERARHGDDASKNRTADPGNSRPVIRLDAANQQAEYFPVEFVMPAMAGDNARGGDHAQYPQRRAAMGRASMNGMPAATAPLALARTGEPAVLVFYPVYSVGFDARSASPAARSLMLRGFVTVIFDLRKLLSGFESAALNQSLQFRLTDLTAGQSVELGTTLLPSIAPSWAGDLAFADRLWRLELAPTPGYWKPKHSMATQATLAGSLLVVFLICLWVVNTDARAVLLVQQIRGRRKAEHSLRALNANLEGEIARRTTELAEREHLFRTTFDIAAIGICHVAPDRTLLRVNARACAITGYSEQEMLRLKLSRITHPDDIGRTDGQIDSLMRGNVGTYSAEKRYVRKDGSLVWVRVSGSAVRDAAGAVIYRILIIEDITESKLAEIKRVASERRYRDMFEFNPVPMWMYDPATLGITAVNEAACRHYGYTHGEFLSLTLRDLRLPEEWPLLERSVQSRPAGYVGPREIRLRKKDGTIVDVEIVSHEITDAGKWQRLVLASDITERRRAEIMQVRQKNVLEGVVKGAPLNDTLASLADLIEECVPGALGSVMLADPKNQFLRPVPGSRLPGEYLKAIDCVRVGEGVGSCGTAASRREPVIVSDIASDPLWSDFSDIALAAGLSACWSIPILDAQGAVLGTFAVYCPKPQSPKPRDMQVIDSLIHTAAIAINKQRESNVLRESEERHRATFEHSALAISHVSADRRFLRVNPSMCAFTGYSEAELLQTGPGKLTYPEDQDKDGDLKRKVFCGEIKSYTVEKRYVRKNGDVVWANVTVSPVFDRDGVVDYTIGIVEDITQRKQAEARFQQQQELNRLLLENLAEGVVACDGNGSLVQFNKVAREWHGTDPRDIPAEQWADHFSLYAADGKTLLRTEEIPLVRAFKGEQVRDVPMSIAVKGAEPRFVLASGAPIDDSQGNRLGAVVAMHDVTERQTTLRKLQLFNNIGEQTRTLVEPTEIMSVITRLLGEHLGASRCAYANVDADADRFTIPTDYTNGCASTAGNYKLELFGPMAVAAMRKGQTLVVRNVETDIPGGAGADMFSAIGIAAIICCPLVKNGRLTAMMAVHQTTPRNWTAEEIAIVEDVVERCWATIERERALHDLRDAANELSAANIAVERERSSLAVRVKERTAELIAMNQDLAQARDQAEAASRAKSTFLATVSHEIRTPMHGVLGAMELLERAGLDGQKGALLNAAQRSAKSLLELLNDLLDMAKIEAGRIEIILAPVALDSIVNQVLSTHLPNAITKGINLSSHIGLEVPPCLAADAMRMRQILGNLVSNAIKFTQQGGVELMVDAQSQGGRMHRVCFRVRDTGKGIPEHELKTLFQPFEQGSAESARKSGGTGLGLAISRGLAERMGGTVRLDSVPGQGVTATLELDLIEADAPLLTPDDETDRPPLASLQVEGHDPALRAAGASILVVDDHPINRLLLVKQLEVLGFTAEESSDGIEALSRLRTGRHIAVITDCEMPRMDGYGLVGAIRRGTDMANKELPVIACTAHALPEVEEKCLASGMNEVLTKPISLHELARALGKWLPKGDVLPVEQMALSPGNQKQVFDRTQLSRVSDGLRDIEVELIDAFRVDQIVVLKDLGDAILARENHQCARLAHRGKGAAMTLGAMALAQAYAGLERLARENAGVAELQEAMRRVEGEVRRLELVLAD